MISESYKHLDDIKQAFPTEEACLRHLEQLRWNGFVISPFDPISKVYNCKNGRYRCRNTGKYFNAKTGTLFYNSKIELQKWFMAIWIISNSKNGITSIELGQRLDVTQKSAWYMLRRIKKHLGLDVPQTDDAAKTIRPGEKLEKPKKEQEIELKVEKDKLQMLEWLQLLKK
ncbi:transposase [Flavobacterium sp.]|uniref:transposase n=1 Tax=Flavobacterium sp. TaxID=239 RepID=UPI0039E5D213